MKKCLSKRGRNGKNKVNEYCMHFDVYIEPSEEEKEEQIVEKKSEKEDESSEKDKN